MDLAVIRLLTVVVALVFAVPALASPTPIPTPTLQETNSRTAIALIQGAQLLIGAYNMNEEGTLRRRSIYCALRYVRDAFVDTQPGQGVNVTLPQPDDWSEHCP